MDDWKWSDSHQSWYQWLGDAFLIVRETGEWVVKRRHNKDVWAQGLSGSVAAGKSAARAAGRRLERRAA